MNILPFKRCHGLLLGSSNGILPIFRSGIHKCLNSSGRIGDTVTGSVARNSTGTFYRGGGNIAVITSSIGEANGRFIVDSCRVIGNYRADGALVTGQSGPGVSGLLVPVHLVIAGSRSLGVRVAETAGDRGTIGHRRLRSLSNFREGLRRCCNNVDGDFKGSTLMCREHRKRCQNARCRGSPLLIAVTRRVGTCTTVCMSGPRRISKQCNIILHGVNGSVFRSASPLTPCCLDILTLGGFRTLLKGNVSHQCHGYQCRILVLVHAMVSVRFSSMGPGGHQRGDSTVVATVLRSPATSLHYFHRVTSCVTDRTRSVRFSGQGYFRHGRAARGLLGSRHLTGLRGTVHRSSTVTNYTTQWQRNVQLVPHCE